MKKVAITGSRGRLAKGVATHVRDAGHEVTLFSRKEDEKFRDIASLAHPEALGAYDAVLHLGWSSVPLVSEENPGIEEARDLPFIRNLIEAARRCGGEPKLIFSSTAAVYGNTGDKAAVEGDPCRPLGRYAAAKLEAEGLFLDYDNACMLRITNAFGMGCPLTRPQGIIPVLLQAARTGAAVDIWGDGAAIKDYIATPDLHRAIEAVITSDLRGIFNVSSGNSLSVNDLISLVEGACGHPILRNYRPHYPWDVTVSHVSSEKLRRMTGWNPKLSPHDLVCGLVRQGG